MIRNIIISAIIAILFFSQSIPAIEMRLIDALMGDSEGIRFGDCCEGMGDINGDGYCDFLTTVFALDELRLYLGGPNPFDYEPVLTWYNHATDLNSFSPVNVGDVDCDGINDFISVFGKENDTIKLFTGLENLNANDYKVIFANNDESWTYRISGGGDNNNDGRPDFWFFNGFGNANDTIRGFSGCDLLDSLPDFYILRSSEPDNKYRVLGRELCTTCDLNGDSIPDIVFGQYTSYNTHPGRVCIIWGGNSLSAVPDLTFYAPVNEENWDYFGMDLTCLGDISGDGIDDIIINQDNREYIYYGGYPFDTVPDLALDWLYTTDMENVGDINNDGFDDVLLAYDMYLFSLSTFIYCYPGMDTLVDVIYSDEDYFQYLNQGLISNVGIDHSRAGDVDGDGIDDILISARSTDADFSDRGWLLIQAGWDSIPTDVDDQDVSTLPNKIRLEQNYPNPFNSGTTIAFTLPRSGYTELRIYNILGEPVAIPLKETLTAGKHKVIWDGKDVKGNRTATGIYIYQIKSGDFIETKSMILLK